MDGPAANCEAPPDISDDALLAEAAQLHDLPAFPRALREHTLGLMQFRESLRLYNKLLANENRFRTVRYLLYLDSDRETFGPDGGASYGRLLELCTRRHEISPRVLKTMLALMTLTGFVQSRRGTTDRRQKFYAPTPRLLEFVRQRLSGVARALDILQPEIERARMLCDDPASIRRVLISAGREHVDGTPPADRMPDFIAFFGKQEGAAPLVFTAILSDMDNTPFPSRGVIAKRYGLSKTQVTNLIADGVQRGLLTVDAAGVAAATAHLRASYWRWTSIELAVHARHMRPQ